MNLSIKIKLIRFSILAGLAMLLLQGEAAPDMPAASGTGEPIAALANPAAVYCTSLGYEYTLEEESEGQSGACLLPDGLQCDEWDFLAGKCGAQFSYCALHGYQTVTRSDGQDPFSQQYAVCTTPDGRQVGTVSELSNLAEQAQAPGCETTLPDQAVPEKQSSSIPAPLAVTESPLATPLEPENNLPSSFDWRYYNGSDWLTSVKNQGICGSCWAFAAAGVAEAAHNIAANNPILDLDLAEQYLVSDCLPSNTCCGGHTYSSFNLIRDYGIPDEACMPYVDGSGCSCSGSCSSSCSYNADGICSDRACSDRCANWEARLVRIGSYYLVNRDVSKIKAALVGQGPLSAYIRMRGSFDGDIYRCVDDYPITHAIVLVGYDDAGEYWIAKNSWGTSWNGDGYFKIGYGECNVESFPWEVSITPIIPDVYEPDDDSEQAQWIYPGSTQSHTIAPDIDQDWVKFELIYESGVVLETSGEFGDSWISLYDSDLDVIEHNNDISYPENTFSRIERECGTDALPAGEYYLKVASYWWQIPGYNLDLQIEPCVTPDAYELDDSAETANSIADGVSQTHNIFPADDQDWVSFELAAESAILLQTSGPTGDTRMWLYDSALDEIEYNDDWQGLFSRIDRECATDPLPAGQYYLKVDEYGNNDVIQSYDLSYTLVEVCTPPELNFKSASYDAREQDGSAWVEVALSKASWQAEQVDYATIDGSALGGADYEPLLGTLSFEPGVISQTLEISLLDDQLDEPDEALTLQLSNPSHAVLGDLTQTTLTILDNDPQPTLSLSEAGYFVPENNDQATISVTLSAPSGRDIHVSYATIDGSALGDADYEPLTGTLGFEPGVISQTLEISLLDDQLDEPDETLTLQLSNPSHAVLGDLVETTLTILDDDPQPMVSLSEAGYFVPESNDQATISVTLNAPSGRDIHVSYATQNGTAAAGSDYTHTEGELTLPAGTTYISLTLPILPDAIVEGDETFSVELNDPLYASLGTPASAVVTIEDDDLYPMPTITDLTPDAAVIGSQPITLEVFGSGFVQGVSVVRCNGADRSTSFISANELHALLPASDLAALGELQISVHNPTPGGGESGPHPFQILPIRLFLPFVKY